MESGGLEHSLGMPLLTGMIVMICLFIFLLALSLSFNCPCP